jgi:hypothetical protein
VLASPSSLTPGCLHQIGAALFSGSGGYDLDIAVIGGLRERLAQVPDPRSPRGMRHSLMSVLLIVICGLAADKNGYTTIEAWARDAPAHVLAAFGVRFNPLAARHVCPDESTLRDVTARVDPAALSAAARDYAADLARGRAIAGGGTLDEREARHAAAGGGHTTVAPLTGYAVDVQAPGAVLEERRCVQPSAERRADGEDVRRDDALGLDGEELAAGRSGATRRRLHARRVQDLPHRRGRDPLPEPSQLTTDARAATPSTHAAPWPSAIGVRHASQTASISCTPTVSM